MQDGSTQSAAVGYPRRSAATTADEEQRTTWMVLTESEYANTDDDDLYRVGTLCERATTQVTATVERASEADKHFSVIIQSGQHSRPD